LVRRGEIYLDKKFIYPVSGNIEDKYILILNKDYKSGDPIYLVTATTKFDKERNNPGCNHRVFLYWLKANEDYFKEDTVFQLFILLNPTTEALFNDKKNKNIIEFRTMLKEETVNKIIKCIKEIESDLTPGFQKYLY
jgi:hypothetical protein